MSEQRDVFAKLQTLIRSDNFDLVQQGLLLADSMCEEESDLYDLLALPCDPSVQNGHVIWTFPDVHFPTYVSYG